MGERSVARAHDDVRAKAAHPLMVMSKKQGSYSHVEMRPSATAAGICHPFLSGVNTKATHAPPSTFISCSPEGASVDMAATLLLLLSGVGGNV